MNIQAKAGNKIITVKIKRPNWTSLYTHYKNIYDIGLYSLDRARARYEYLGGEALREYNRASKLYDNTCGLLVSYALNHSGFPIRAEEVKNISGTKLKDKNGYIYLTGAREVQQLLQNKLKKLDWRNRPKERADFVKTFYERNEINIIHYQDGYSIMDISDVDKKNKFEELKETNKQFYESLKYFNTTGIICMTVDGWNNAYGHTTLWNGEEFVDGSNYLMENDIFLVREIYFWYIK